MDVHQAAVIANDDREVHDPRQRLLIRAKLAWYGFTRPIFNARLRRMLQPVLKNDPVFARVDRFLNGDGGMFKEYAYDRCDRLRPIKGASVLVPGVGYAKNILQLAALRPKEIVAFDLFEYPEIWQMVAEKVRADFGVPITFLKGDFDVVPADRKGSFDLIISDAVLEHVPDMPKFAAASRDFLKPGGIFYASFGPLWYGPSGDHVTWGPEKLFDHLLLPEAEYKQQLEKQIAAQALTVADQDSCDAGFMIETGLFSYLRAEQYLADMDACGFKMIDLWTKVSPEALRLLLPPSPHAAAVNAALDAKGMPAFDRFSGGLYIWAQKK